MARKILPSATSLSPINQHLVKNFLNNLLFQHGVAKATYVPPQRQAVHRDHRSQDCEESLQAPLSLDASTEPLVPGHKFKTEAGIRTGLAYRKDLVNCQDLCNTWPCFRHEVGATITLVSIPESATGIALYNLQNSHDLFLLHVLIKQNYLQNMYSILRHSNASLPGL